MLVGAVTDFQNWNGSVDETKQVACGYVDNVVTDLWGSSIIEYLFGMWANTGLWIGLGTLLATVVLESVSLPSVRAILAAPGGVSLYMQAWCYTVVNALAFGPPVYGLLARWLVHERSCGGPVGCAMSTLVLVSALLAIHSLGYWYAHKSMHTIYLWWAHSFHHRFSTVVTPCVAMAVSPVEYLVAYMMPFVIGGLLTRPDGISLLIAVCIVSLSNLLVHTERLLSLRLPWFLVSAEKHLLHHRKPNKHYAAPTFDVDAILLRFESCILPKHDREQ